VTSAGLQKFGVLESSSGKVEGYLAGRELA